MNPQPASPDPSWTHQAACIGWTDTFAVPEFTRGRSKAAAKRIARAKLICDTCPVKAQCRDWALTLPDPAKGLVAGGLTEAERKHRRNGRSVA